MNGTKERPALQIDLSTSNLTYADSPGINTENEKRQNAVIQKGLLFALIFAFGGIFGFLNEEMFYRIDLGYWVKRGSTFGPWIPIYGVGALIIALAADRLRNKPLMTFITATTLCGVPEYATGWVLLNEFQTRLWDSNREVWNWGNIGGFICFRSVLFFGISAMFLQYVFIPLLNKLSQKCDTPLKRLAAFLPAVLFLADILVFDLLNMLA